eukprot:g26960.t1
MPFPLSTGIPWKRQSEFPVQKVSENGKGQTFESLTAAAMAIGVKQPNISQAIVSGGKSGGYHWTYATMLPEVQVPEIVEGPISP